MAQGFFASIGVNKSNSHDVKGLAKLTGIPYKTLMHYDQAHIAPSDSDMPALEHHLKIHRYEIYLRMGIYTHEVKNWLSENANLLADTAPTTTNHQASKKIKIAYRSKLGKLYNSDCLEVLRKQRTESVDLIFADPPFNLGKDYGSEINDKLDPASYENWCQEWLDECARILKPGGSFFLWHIPKWAQRLSGYISQQLTFRHWISVKQNNGLPISGRLYPAHYSLLYFTKGPTPNSFSPDRIQIDTCRKCGHEQRDYGGHRNKLNPYGLSMQDVWLDIHPVKHKKNRTANELPISLLDRIIEMASKPDDVVLDPFGGTGVTYIVAELKGRKWIGCELGDIEPILNRFRNKQQDKSELENIRQKVNCLFSSDVSQIRTKNNLWTDPRVPRNMTLLAT